MENKFRGITTMTLLKFIWIDDDNTRSKYFKKNLEAYRYEDGAKTYQAEVEFLSVQEKDTIKTIAENKKLFYRVDLVIIDHVLNHTKDPCRRGTTVAEVIREIVPLCPIIGVTAVEKKKYLNQNVFNNYEDLFFIGDVSESRSAIFVIAMTFKQLKNKRLNSLRAKINLFLPDDEDIQIFEKILPSDLNNLGFEKSYIRSIARWTLHELLSKPGLLYNRQWAANLIGIKESSFYKVEKLFYEAKYKGIFCNNEDPRWWKSKLKKILFKKVKNNNISRPWEAGHFLHGILKSDYSICYSCNRNLPETMGYLDTTEKSKLVPLHYQHSKPYPAFRNELFFDEIRIMKDIK
jgi:hypothetical protein